MASQEGWSLQWQGMVVHYLGRHDRPLDVKAATGMPMMDGTIKDLEESPWLDYDWTWCQE
eukprot:1017798-Karenia_brevis.AAC.1